MRVFIAIDLPENVRKAIRKIQGELPEFVGKKTEAENIHLTLKFLGEIEEKKVELVKEKLKEIKLEKFEAEINSLGVFSPSFVRIVWLHLTNCDKLQKEVDEKLKDLFFKEERFMSHLTIARIKACDKKEFLERLKKIKIEKIRFMVENFKLKKSVLNPEKPVYEDLLRIELA